MRARHAQRGFTLLELTIAVALAALILAGLGSVITRTLDSSQEVGERNALAREARFAMNRMLETTRNGSQLLIPLVDNPKTDSIIESIREQRIPATDDARGTAVLAVTLDPTLDRDRDGYPDADNDRDGRIDEDPDNDSTRGDGASGIEGIDDNGDGIADNGKDNNDDDEDGVSNEDIVNFLDDDGDGSIDEDPKNDSNDDDAPGLAGVDDNNDGIIDNGKDKNDDDEDGLSNEDWLDPIVFYLKQDDLDPSKLPSLIERLPTPSGKHAGDYSESVLARNVTHFRVERVAGTMGDRAPLVNITLELSEPQSGRTHSIQAQVRAGAYP